MNNVICDWCTPAKDPYRLKLGPGKFRDLDSDLGYGVPVCPACGGLGVQFDDPDFKKRTKEISELRFAYCPTDKNEAAKLTDKEKYEALKELAAKVKELVTIYGEGADGSYAGNIVKGEFDETLMKLRR